LTVTDFFNEYFNTALHAAWTDFFIQGPSQSRLQNKFVVVAVLFQKQILLLRNHVAVIII